MKKILLLLCLMPLLMAHTCNDDDHFGDDRFPCTTEARAALNVTVTLDGQTNVSEAGITVIAVDGDFAEELEAFGQQPPVFSGAYERPGRYIITVSKQGYETFISEVIRVERDYCHVVPRQISVNLISK